jgi:hypothetical protein
LIRQRGNFAELSASLKTSVVGEVMDQAKIIDFKEFGFILRAPPTGFLTVQISENNQGIAIYREPKFQLYNTEKYYTKYNRFVPATHLFLTFMGHEK